MQMYVTVVEAVKIQSYVFGSNRLRENIGASHLVWQATELWPFEAVLEVCGAGKHNILITENRPDLDPTVRIENGGVDAEIIYAAGGNVLILFRDQGLAKRFAMALSRRALEEAPGLRLLIATKGFEWDASGCPLRDAVDKVFGELRRMKEAPELSAPLLGLGVTVPCGSTGLPAVGWVKLPDGTRQPASAEVMAKDRAAESAGERLKRTAALAQEYRFPTEFDNLGRARGEFSYIAVGHADGDSMGKTIQEVGKEATDNRSYINKLRAFSRALNDVGQAAFEATLQALLQRIERRDGKPVIRETADGDLVTEVELVQVPGDSGRWYLPFRPLIFGGDDFTFVSDGRLGLALLMKFMSAFRSEAERRKNAFAGRTLTASGGVAIVKGHYPFARAYSLAEELCHAAKYHRERELNGEAVPCLDWHFAQAGLLGSLREIRERQYRVKLPSHRTGRLELRPVVLVRDARHSCRDWPTIEEGIKAFRSPDWLGRRNKMKALISALRGGPEAVKQFRDLYNDGRSLPKICDAFGNWPEQGWQGPHCGYYDSLELVDWYVSL